MDSGRNYPYQTKEIFLIYGGNKEFVVKSYVDASFNTDLDDSKSQSGYILKVGALARVAPGRALQTQKFPKYMRI